MEDRAIWDQIFELQRRAESLAEENRELRDVVEGLVTRLEWLEKAAGEMNRRTAMFKVMGKGR